MWENTVHISGSRTNSRTRYREITKAAHYRHSAAVSTEAILRQDYAAATNTPKYIVLEALVVTEVETVPQ
jgi:hypothetical protein